jgi:hypothetical protein
MAITKEDLKKHGFRYHKGLPTLSVNSDNIRYYVGFWQKQVSVEGASDTYFVNIEEWDLSDAVKTVFVEPFSPWVQFEDADGVPGMEVNMHVKRDYTVDDVLAFFEKVRTSMGYLTPTNPVPAAA